MVMETDCSDASTSQGTPRMAGNHHKLAEAGKDPPLETSEGVELCRHLDFRLLASRTVRQYISIALKPQFVVLCDDSPRK